MRKMLAVIMAIASVFSLMTFSASAENADESAIVITRGDVDFIFEAGISEDIINSFIYAVEHEYEDCDDTAAYGLTCTLFGHKLELSTASTITHKASATDPRCLCKTYAIEACTRCDYTSTRMIANAYISCC